MNDVTESSLVIAGRNRGGRPRTLSQPGYRISSWVPECDADELMKLASYNGKTVSEFVRDLIERAVRA